MSRTFKTKWFARRAVKEGISDAELCQAIREVALGQADDLGGGVYKKRLNDNDLRGIVLAKGGKYWIYQYVFAKQDKSSLKPNELADFRKLAKGYEALRADQLKTLLDDGDLVEICNEEDNCQGEIQE